LEKEAKELGLKDKVIFTGLVSRESVPEMIALMDVVVHTSLREGLARVIPQAMAMGKPVIAFDLDGTREVLDDGGNGFLVKAGDVEALTRALRVALSDRPRLREMGWHGRKRIEPDFDKDYMVRQIEGVYEEFLARLK
jgi:glycosyltransferase involved in cell wall biosynthesis